MTNTTLVPPATTDPRAFGPQPGTYEAVVAAAAVLNELEDLDAVLHGSVPLITKRVRDARERLNQAQDAHMAGFPC